LCKEAKGKEQFCFAKLDVFVIFSDLITKTSSFTKLLPFAFALYYTTSAPVILCRIMQRGK